MTLRTVRWGELLAGTGGLCIVAALCVAWYEAPTGSLNAWDTFGPTIVLLMAAGASALWLLLATLTERSTAMPVAAAVWTVTFGLIGLICAIVRLLERPDHATQLCAGPWLALAGVMMIMVGSWQSMRDERGGAYTPAAPQPRPRP